MNDDEKQARDAAQLKRFRTHLDLAERAAHFGYWRYEFANNSTYWSPGMYLLMGIDPAVQAPDNEWLLGQLRPAEKTKIKKAISVAIKTRSPFAYRTQTRSPDVTAQIVDTQGEVEIDEKGRIVAILGVCYDVTAQVRAEEARENAQLRYHIIAEGASDIIILYSAEYKIQFASSALDRVLKRSVEEIDKDKYLNLVHPDDRDAVAEANIKPAPGETLTATYRVKHGDGHYIWLEVTTRALYDDATGEFRNLISVARDVTDRRAHELETKVAQERAEAANRAKSRFLANMSHELRTPLNAIIGFTDLMRQHMFGPLGNERYEEYATMIYDSGQLLLDLISDMLDMAKIEAGKFELNFERVDLTGTVEDSARLLRDRADNTGVELSVYTPQIPILLVADRRAVKQILLNLLSNAIKFTPAGGHVGVSVRNENGHATVIVRDTGIGIPASELPRLGRPFEQVCGDPMLAKAGAGLGLALVRSLIEKHGGDLRVESEEGVGTQVSVDFPLSQAGRAAA